MKELQEKEKDEYKQSASSSKPSLLHSAVVAVSRYSNGIAAFIVAIGFFWRVWLAHATFFNTDEAWHYSIANQSSLALAYKASLNLLHPPLLVIILYFWKGLGTSNLMLRLPCVIAGTIFCWVFWKWVSTLFGKAAGWAGLILVTFLPPMIALSADLRQYTLMLAFATGAAYLLELALAENSARFMTFSALCLYLALLSHYSAFLFAGALGVYGLVRIVRRRPAKQVLLVWIAGQAVGLGLCSTLYLTHIVQFTTLYPSASLRRYADWYLGDWYFHPERDHLLHFLYHGTFGVFRFDFGQITVGEIAALMFAVGIILLLVQRSAQNFPLARPAVVFLLLPFVLNCAAVEDGLYPYGRTRQCVFLAVFAIAGVSVFLAKIARQKIVTAVALALAMVAACHVFGTLQGRDMLPLADQRHEHMDDALAFIHAQVSPGDVIFVDASSETQLSHYLCRQKHVDLDHSMPGFDSFQCDGLRVISTAPNAGNFSADTFTAKVRELRRSYGLKPGGNVWVFQAGWSGGLGEALRARSSEFSGLEIHSFGHNLQIFRLSA